MTQGGIGIELEQLFEPLTGPRQVIELQVKRAQIEQGLLIFAVELEHFVVFNETLLVLTERGIKAGQE